MEFYNLRQEYPFLSDRLHFKWAQLIDSIPLDWRINIGFSLYLLFRQVVGTKLWLSNLYYHVCDQGYNLFGCKIDCVGGGGGGVVVKLVLGWKHRKLDFRGMETCQKIPPPPPPHPCTSGVVKLQYANVAKRDFN